MTSSASGRHLAMKKEIPQRSTENASRPTVWTNATTQRFPRLSSDPEFCESVHRISTCVDRCSLVISLRSEIADVRLSRSKHRPSHSRSTLFTWRPAITRYVSIRLESLSSRGWCRTPAHAPLITASLLKPFARAHVQLAIQLCRRLLAMYEVAEAAAHTALAAIETTAGFAEIGDGR
jgi:hypothetical protein